jgi:thioredoxin-like negative regulator of GroEL
MKQLSLLALLFTLLCLSLANKDWFRNREAQILTHKTIGKTLLVSHDTKIITFLRPESFDCQGLTLVLEDYAHDLKRNEVNNVSFYEVNCADEEHLCSELGVSEVPFVFVFNPDGMAENEFPASTLGHEMTYNMLKEAVAKINSGDFIKASKRSKIRIAHLGDL